MIRNAIACATLATLAGGCTGSALDNAVWMFLVESLENTSVEASCTETLKVNFDAVQCESTASETFTEEYTRVAPQNYYFAEIIELKTKGEEKYKKLMILEDDAGGTLYLYGRKEKGQWVFEWDETETTDYSLSHNFDTYVYAESAELAELYRVTLDIAGGVATGTFSTDITATNKYRETDDFSDVDEVPTPAIQNAVWTLDLYDGSEGCDPADRTPFNFRKDKSDCDDANCQITFTQACQLELELIGYLTSDDGLGAAANQ